MILVVFTGCIDNGPEKPEDTYSCEI